MGPFLHPEHVRLECTRPKFTTGGGDRSDWMKMRIGVCSSLAITFSAARVSLMESQGMTIRS